METNVSHAELTEIGRAFDLPGMCVSRAPFGTGHIHATFLVEYRSQGRVTRYLHQRINALVFPDPAALMENLVRVLDHLREKNPPHRAPTLVPARDGRFWARDERGAWWRTWRFIEGSKSFDVALGPRQAYEAARAFGSFERDLLDLPGPPLHETIAGFHDTPGRLEAFRRALAEDRVERADSVRSEVELALSLAPLAGALRRLRENGLVDERIVHNDTKLGNVLFDAATGEALAVVDLDTVMPGLSLYDFGDLVRTVSSRAAEDDPRGARVEPALFEALARGFLEPLRGIVSPAERDSLVLAGQVIAYECALRFLTDHLDGDRYFGARYEGQNAQRCRAQLALVRSLEESEDVLRSLVERT